MASYLPSTSPSRRKPRLWDGVTISLAIAVVLLGVLIWVMPRSGSTAPRKHSNPAHANHLTQNMASIAVKPLGLA